MTSPVHPAPEQIADLQEGNLPAHDVIDVTAHVATCTECGALRDALLDVTAFLGEEGATDWQLPPEVAARLDGALSRASSDRADGVRHLGDERRSSTRQPLRWLAGAAAAVVIAGAGVTGWQALSNQHTSSTATSGDQENSGPDRPAIGQFAGGAAGAGVPSGIRTAAGVAREARRLAEGTRPPDGTAPLSTTATPRSGPQCATPTTGSRSHTVMFRGRFTVLSIDPATRMATIYDCATASRALFTTSY